MTQTVGITKTVERQCDLGFGGTRITVRQLIQIREAAEKALNNDPSVVKEGYAPFVKIVRLENLRDNMPYGEIRSPIVLITIENMKYLESKYKARSKNELPVLIRYFSDKSGIDRMLADHINVILYSKAQIDSESAATKTKEPISEDWGIISINAEPDEFDSPLTPATMLRNHLGKEHGGSGASINREEYMKAVEFWSKYAMVS